MKDTSLLYKIALTLIDDIGAITAKRLITHCGSAEAVFAEKKKNLLKIPNVGEVITKRVGNNKQAFVRAEKELKFIEKERVNVLFYLDKDYPKRLLHCDDGPVVLYTKGNTDFNAEKIIAVVGTREPTDYGKKVVEEIISNLALNNVLVISGLAYGIDICAHRQALKMGLHTVAVLAHGLDKVYPASHRSTSVEIIQSGALITEFLSETMPDRENFPKRNRIVAGMVDAVLVVESSVKGGSMITADIANSYSRDVFAIPGRVGDKASEGCNRLIKLNKAALIESASDIELQLGWTEKSQRKEIQKKLFIELDEDEKTLMDILLKQEKIAIDDFSLAAKMSMSKTSSVLLNLEFKGLIKTLPGKMYTAT